MPEKRERIQSIDALRGLSIIMMVFYHLFYDLVVYLGAPEWIFSNPVFDFLQIVFAGIFILLAGVSSRFSRSNLKRGFIILALAIGVTLVTYFFGAPDYFGILHFMGLSMIIYGLTFRFFDRVPEKPAPYIYILLIIVWKLLITVFPVSSPYLWAIGIPSPNFTSADYFPLLPWFFVFLTGTWLGKLVRERRLPERIYTFKIPFFPAVGRHTLLIYLIHQPVFIGLVYLIDFLR